MRTRLAAGACLGTALLVAGCGGGSSAGSLAGKSPSQILSAAISAAERQTSVHYLLQATGASAKQTISGDAGQHEGDQTVTTGTDEVEVEVIGTAAFLKGNAGGLQHTMGLPATVSNTYADKWISVAPSDSLYQPITAAVTINSIFSQLKPSGKLEASTPGKVANQEVIGVKGGLPSAGQSSATGSAVLYVSTDTTTLPVGFAGQATSGSQSVSDVGAFTHWGEPLHLSAPSGAVPFASLPKS